MDFSYSHNISYNMLLERAPFIRAKYFHLAFSIFVVGNNHIYDEFPNIVGTIGIVQM